MYKTSDKYTTVREIVTEGKNENSQTSLLCMALFTIDSNEETRWQTNIFELRALVLGRHVYTDMNHWVSKVPNIFVLMRHHYEKW